MPLELTVLIWVGVVCLGLITVLLAGFVLSLALMALEIRKLARGIGAEVRWISEQRRYFTNRARFAGKWLRIMSRRMGRNASRAFD